MMGRLRHAARPRLFSVHAAPAHETDHPTVGQQVAERTAAAVGSWAFISAQAAVMALWVLVNTLTLTGALHFDQYPFVFLNLAMSAEAAFTGPILLIAANVSAMRDHAQADRIEKLTAQNEHLAEQNVQLVDRLVNIEQLLEEHINASLAAHTSELRDLKMLVREVHVAVCAPTGMYAASDGADDDSLAAMVATPLAGARGDTEAAKSNSTTGYGD